MSGELQVVVTTFPDRDLAEKVSRLMVDAGLAVCAQVGADLVSFYRWENSVKRDQEVAVTFKVLGELTPVEESTWVTLKAMYRGDR